MRAAVLEPEGYFVLPVAPVERVEGGIALRGRLALKFRQLLPLGGGEALVVLDGEELGLRGRVAQVFRSATGRGGRVVQLVG